MQENKENKQEYVNIKNLKKQADPENFNKTTQDSIPIYQCQPQEKSNIIKIVQVGQYPKDQPKPSIMINKHVFSPTISFTLISCLYNLQELKDIKYLNIIKLVIYKNNVIHGNLVLSSNINNITFNTNINNITFNISLFLKNKQKLLKTYKEYTSSKLMIDELILLFSSPEIQDLI